MHSISRAKRTCSTHGLALAVVALAMAGPVAAVVVRDDLSMESTAERAKPYANSIAWLHLLDDAGLILAEGTVLSPEWVLTAANAVDRFFSTQRTTTEPTPTTHQKR